MLGDPSPDSKLGLVRKRRVKVIGETAALKGHPSGHVGDMNGLM